MTHLLPSVVLFHRKVLNIFFILFWMIEQRKTWIQWKHFETSKFLISLNQLTLDRLHLNSFYLSGFLIQDMLELGILGHKLSFTLKWQPNYMILEHQVQ